MLFEFDEAKSRHNKKKHGIDFVEAQALWSDADRIEVATTHRGEPRFQVTGNIGGKFWSAFITYRGGRVRIISVRRSRKKEIAQYEEEDEGHG